MAIERASFAVDAWPASLFRQYADECTRGFLVAAAGRRIAGYSIVCFGRGESELVSIAVDGRFQGKGVATRLIRRSLEIAERERAESVWLMVRTGNTAAIALYRKLGFKRVRTVSGYYEDGGAAWRMHMAIN